MLNGSWFRKTDNNRIDDGTANDATENELDATLINSPSFKTETVNGSGKAIFFNSQKVQYMSIPYNPFKGIENYTATMWVKDFGYGSFFDIKVDYEVSEIRFYYDEDGFFKFILSAYFSSYEKTFTYDAKSLIDGNWHMIAFSKSTDVCELYVDGSLVASAASPRDYETS